MRKTRRNLLKNVGAIGSFVLSGGLSAANILEAEQAGNSAGPSSRSSTFKCVVTGETSSGKSVIVSHAPAPPITVALMPGYKFYPLWGEDSHPVLASDGAPMVQPHWFPQKNGFCFALFTVPPASSFKSGPAPDPAELEEVRHKLSGMLEVLEPDHPGMHTTDTVDFDIVVFGEIVLEVDDGTEALLKAGDCVIQNGTRHAWHNRSAEKCMISSCLIGAGRRAPGSSAGE